MIDGRPHRAQSQIALGVRLAQTRGMMALEESNQVAEHTSMENRAVAWTLFMLDRVFLGRSVTTAMLPSSSYQLCLLQHGPQLTGTHAGTKPVSLHTPLQNRIGKSANILSENVEILQLWEQVIGTSFRLPADGDIPFWKDGSLLSRTLSSLLEFELSRFDPWLLSRLDELTGSRDSPTSLCCRRLA